ncbi:MAG TPA: hypothetical protein VLT82_22820 [Myxococcaceae bacterium]|nr:hypothetical protein [Myxococcaceae bacterium]
MNEQQLEALRAAWAARPPTAPGPGCPPPDAIWEAVAGQRAEDEVRTMLEHSLGCPDCSALWRLARELRSVDEPRAAATFPAGPVPLWRARPIRWFAAVGTLAAAAVVALAILPRGGTHAPAPVVRGAEEFRLRADPASETLPRAHPVLRWTGAPDGSRYTVVVSKRDLTVLFRKSGLAAAELELPADALADVPAGGEVVWRVEAIAPGGRRISSEAFLSRVQ